MTDARTRDLARRRPSEAYKPARREFNFAEANAIMDADETVRLERKAAASPSQWVRTETMAMRHVGVPAARALALVAMLLVIWVGCAQARVLTTPPGVTCANDTRFATNPPVIASDFCFQSTTNDLLKFTSGGWVSMTASGSTSTFTDITAYDPTAICNGSSIASQITTAFAAGERRIYVPSGCSFGALTIPDNAILMGSGALTLATGAVTVGNASTIASVTYQGKYLGQFTNTTGTARVADAVNFTALANIYKGHVSGAVDQDTSFTVTHMGLGDGDNIFSQTDPSGTATNFQQALYRADLYATHAVGGRGFDCFLFLPTSTDSKCFRATDFRVTPNSAMFLLQTDSMTSGKMAHIAHSAAAGGAGLVALQIDMGLAGGSFTGSFITLNKGTDRKFLFTHGGNLVISGESTISLMETGGGTDLVGFVAPAVVTAPGYLIELPAALPATTSCLTLSAGGVMGTTTCSTLAASLTAGRVPFATGAAALADDPGLAWDNVLKALVLDSTSGFTGSYAVMSKAGTQKFNFAHDGNLVISGASTLTLTETGGGTDVVAIAAPAAVTSSYTITLPGALPGAASFLQMSTGGVLSLTATGLTTTVSVRCDGASGVRTLTLVAGLVTNIGTCA